VLLIILDSVRAASLGLYGNVHRTTPNLDRQADGWVIFDRAYSTAPWTLPSHSSIFTGFYPQQLSANWLTPLDNVQPTIAEAFRNHGYRTGGFVANMNYASAETGLARGFVHYEDYPLSKMYLRRATALGYFLDTWRAAVKPGRRSRAIKPACRLSADFLAWLDQTQGRPFFAFLNYYDAHQPYQAPDSLRRRFQSADRVRDGYEAAIASLDQELVQLVDQLKSRHLLENTVVVITSDHGELLGEHNLVGHANSLYQEVLEVPLLIRYEGRTPHGLRIGSPVTLRDLAATLTNLAGLSQSFPGSSLTRFWDPTPTSSFPSPIISYVTKGIRTPPADPVSRGTMRSIFRDNLQLIVNGDAREELFDLRADPLARQNLAGTDSAAGTQLSLRAALDEAFAGANSGSGQQTTAHTGTMGNLPPE
jgi:arylsulfatase A-like enzyme